MSREKRSLLIRSTLLVATTVAVLAGTTLVPRAQTPATPAPAPVPAQTPPVAPGGGAAGRGGRGAVDAPGADFAKRPAVVRQTPEDEQKMFILPEGYHIENVLADPQIEDPVSVSFDGNGRMYLLEMPSYMRDAEGTGALDPVCRITRWEDTDGDGKYDKRTVFADKLVLPRIAFPLQDGVVLVLETDNRDLYKYTDTNGDGVADKKEVFYPNFGRVQNLEWQPGGAITWALDNWMYSTYNPFRLRIAPDGKVLREETAANGGQWGSAQDNDGKVWWVDGGGEIGPVNFQVPILYGAMNVPDNFETDFQAPWGQPGGIADMQGGMNRVRLPDGVLNHFTAAAGPAIYRGDRLPADLVGDLLFNEPVGRVVRRAKIVVKDGLTQLQNAYPKAEFIRSTDPLFRPVNIIGTPDGTLYLMDMYVGLIQDAQFVGGPGSYLRRKNDQYELDKQHNMGRIWRITHDGLTPDRTAPRMYSETPAQLVAHLSHPNGWWRDTAQKLLVLKQDKSVVPALKTMAQTSTNVLARIHALWTLEGLGSADAALVRELVKSSDPKLRIQAIRVSESLYKAGDKTFANDYRALLKDADVDVAIQAMLTINVLHLADAPALTRSMIDTSSSRGVKEIGGQLLRPGSAQGQQPSLADAGSSTLNLSPAERAVMARGDATYRELCFSCHGNDGKGAPVAGAADGSTLAPPLAGSPRVQGHRDYVIKVLLAGLTGPIEGTTYNGGAVMVPMGANDDEWIANVATYVRNSFGNSAGFVTPAQVAAVRKAVSRKSPWTEAELLPTIPTLLTNSAEWTLTASHNATAVAGAISGATATRWDSGAAQQPGMWLQVELPRPTMIAEVQIDASVPAPLFGARGGGPRAGGPGGPAAPGAAGAPGAPGAAPAAGAGRGAAGAAPAAGPQTGAPTAGAAGAPAGAPGGPGGAAAGPAGAAAAAGRGRGGRGGGPPASGPVAYTLTVSSDGTTWSAPLAQGAGATPTTVIPIRPTTAKFVRVTQTGTAIGTEFWGVAQVRIYQAPQR